MDAQVSRPGWTDGARMLARVLLIFGRDADSTRSRLQSLLWHVRRRRCAHWHVSTTFAFNSRASGA